MAVWTDRDDFRQFWPIHIAFFFELLVYSLAAASVVFVTLASGIDDDTAESIRFLGGQRLIFFLPIIVGVPIRWRCARTLWLLLAWLYCFSPIQSTAASALLLGNAVLLTIALLATPAGRRFFRDDAATTVPCDTDRILASVEPPARALLRRRTHGVITADAAKTIYRQRLMHVLWVCGIAVAWIISWLGHASLVLLLLVFAIFLLHRRASPRKRIFFPSLSPDRSRITRKKPGNGT